MSHVIFHSFSTLLPQCWPKRKICHAQQHVSIAALDGAICCPI
uniref:Uncharacterized protein n=1 Tax=Arundo donax TaxID=35708 RepID=A0A0A8Z480_ARUDO